MKHRSPILIVNKFLTPVFVVPRLSSCQRRQALYVPLRIFCSPIGCLRRLQKGEKSLYIMGTGEIKCSGRGPQPSLLTSNSELVIFRVKKENPNKITWLSSLRVWHRVNYPTLEKKVVATPTNLPLIGNILNGLKIENGKNQRFGNRHKDTFPIRDIYKQRCKWWVQEECIIKSWRVRSKEKKTAKKKLTAGGGRGFLKDECDGMERGNVLGEL